MSHNHYVTAWTLACSEAPDVRGRIYGQTLEYARSGITETAEGSLVEYWNGLLEGDQSEVSAALEAEKGLTLDRALLDCAIFMDDLAHGLGSEAA